MKKSKPPAKTKEELAHEHSSYHKEELKRSTVIGCFYCGNFIKFAAIKEWIDKGDTALCPKCGIDSVIGNDSGYTINKGFLTSMNKHWFSREDIITIKMKGK